MIHSPRRRLFSGLLATTLAVAMVAGACGGGDDNGGGDPTEEGTPEYGGEVTYALEAENSGGWCLPEGQLAISGIMVARAIYDTLTAPNADGEYVPFLAESVEPNADFTQWTVKVREGITFHDGSPLNAQVVVNNLNAYRGQYPPRQPLLFLFVLGNIADVQPVDDMTLTITTKTPWPSLPAYLYGSGRMGIIAQAQLDDAETCDTNLIGTGPFKLVQWAQNDFLETERNENYWAKDGDGNQLPYLDKLTFKPIVDGSARTNALLAGQINVMHTTSAEQTVILQQEAEAGNINLYASDDYAEVAYGMFNMAKPPFDNIKARQAVAYGLDRDLFQEVRLQGQFQMASGPFGPGEVGYLEDAGFPEFDLEKSKQLVAEYEAETGQPLEFTLTTVNDPETQATSAFLQEQAELAGMKVNLKAIEQAQLINTALGGDWQVISWRNHPGGEPDSQYVWWYPNSPVNFGKINDPEIASLLDQGRAESDPAKRKEIYEEINREFSKETYNLWLNWSEWNIATATDVRGLLGPPLPGGSEPFPGLAAGHSLAGLWIQQ